MLELSAVCDREYDQWFPSMDGHIIYSIPEFLSFSQKIIPIVLNSQY